MNLLKVFLGVLLPSFLSASFCLFTPPQGFFYTDPKKTPSGVEIALVSKGKGSFTPSLNLTKEKSALSLSAYLECAQKCYRKDEARWSDLGSIPIQGGLIKIIQVDLLETAWGEIRLLQAIIPSKDTYFVLTAAAEKKEFQSLRKDFLKTFASIQIKDELFSAVTLEKRKVLEEAFQTLSEKKLIKFLKKHHSDLSPYHQALLIKEKRKNTSQNTSLITSSPSLTGLQKDS